MNLLKKVFDKTVVSNVRWYINKYHRDDLRGYFNEIYLRSTYIDDCSEIGKHTYIGNNVSITNAKIGRYCSIANNVSIGPGEHDIEKISTSSIFYEDAAAELTKGTCILGHDVWVGVNSIIRRGVTIGNGSIIGANSFVNKDVPAFTIVAGSPAITIRERFKPQIVEGIEETKWWDFEPEKAREKMKNLSI